MVVDATGMKLATSKLEVITNAPEPITVEELHPFLGIAGYPGNSVSRFSIVAAPLMDSLRN